MLRRVVLGVGALALVVGGCSCEETVPPSSGTVTITAPLDGTTIRVANDVDLVQAGIQIDVDASTTGFSTAAEGALSIDGNAASATAMVDVDGSVSFSRVTLASGSRVLAVTVTEGAKTATASVQVVVEQPPGTPVVQITAPADGTTLNKAADLSTDPKLQARVTVHLENVNGGILRICSVAAGDVGAACDNAPGRVISQGTIGPAASVDLGVDLPEGPVDLTAEVRDSQTTVVTASQTVNVTVDTALPTITFQAPGPGDITAVTPVVVRVATTAEEGQVVTIGGAGSAVSGAVDSNGELSTSLALTDGDYTLTADVSDAAGNPATQATVTFTVDTSVCNLTMKIPAGATAIFGGAADKDSNPANGLQVDLVANTTNCKGLTPELTAKLFISGTESGTAIPNPTTGDILFADVTFQDGMSNVPVEVQLTNRTQRTASVNFTVSVILAGPTLQLFTDTSVRNLLNDRDYTTPGIQTQGLVQASVVQGGTIYICSTMANGPSPTACPGGGYVVSSVLAHTGTQTSFYGITLSEGQQTLHGEVVDSAGNLSVSPGVAVLVDATPPVVTAFTIQQDSPAPGDGYLNNTELPTGQLATLLIDVTAAEGRTLIVYDQDGAGTALGQGPVTSGRATISTALGDATHALLAKVFSANGNPNVSTQPPIVNAAAHKSVTVDRTAAELILVHPATPFLNAADGTVNGTLLTYELVAASDNATVAFYLDGSPTPQTANVVSGFARLSVSLTQGPHSVEARAVDVAGNVASRSASFTVDSLPPTLTFNSPSLNQTFDTFAVPVDLHADDLSGTGFVTGTTLVTVSSSAVSSGPVGSQVVDASGNAAFTVLLPNGVGQVLTATIVDRAGNVGTATVTITVNALGCSLRLTAPSPLPAMYGRAADKDSNPANGLQVDIRANTSDCMGRMADLYVGASGTPVQSVAADSGTGNIVFLDVTFADGARDLDVRIEMLDSSSQLSSLPFKVNVKLTLPRLVGVTPAAPSSGSLYVVHPDNPRVGVNPNYIKDEVTGNADADVAFGMTVENAAGGTLSLKLGTQDLFTPVAALADPEVIAALGATIPQNSVGTAVLLVVDPYGNSASINYPLVVDVIPPDAPVFAGPPALTTPKATLLDSRNSMVQLQWTSPGDDGMTGDVAGYEVKYITSTMAGTSFTCPTLSQTVYDTTAITVANPPAGGPAAQAISFSVDKLPPLNCYAIAVRAQDEVGNVSAFGSVVTQKNYWNTFWNGDGTGIEPVLSGATASSYYSYVMRTGDLNGDGRQDLVVAARAEAPGGAVYVYYGSPTGFSLPQKLTGRSANELFGGALAIGDVSGDGIDDLVVAASGFSSNLGRVSIFFGRQGQPIDPSQFVEIRGRAATGRFGYSSGFVGNTNGDFVTDGSGIPHALGDIAIGARFDGTSGHSFLFYGRSEAQWFADRTSTDSSTTPPTPYVSANNASRSIVGELTSEQLGTSDGYTSLGDLNGDTKSEFSIPASRDTVNRLYLFNGATVESITGREIGPSDATILTTPEFGTTGVFEGFGSSVIGGLDFDGDGFPDLVVGHPLVNKVYVYRGDSVAGAIGSQVGSPLSKGEPLTFFGHTIATGDLNGDGHRDLVIGSGTFTNTVPTAATFWVYLNNGTANPFSETASILKLRGGPCSVETGDYYGNGSLEVVVGCAQDGPGAVHVFSP